MSKRITRVALATCVLAVAAVVVYYAAANQPPVTRTESAVVQPATAYAPAPASVLAPKPQPVKTKAPMAAQNPGAAGVMAFKDPVTGKLRQPDASEIGALARPSSDQAVSTTATAPVQFRTRGGFVGVKLGPEHMSYMVVTKTPDGKLKEDCVMGKTAAEETVAGAQTHTAKGALDVK